MNEPTPLPEDLRAYLDAAREIEPPPAGTPGRLLARLAPLLPHGGGSSGGHDPSAADPSSAGAGAAAGSRAAASSVLQGKLMVAAVSVAIGAAGGAGLHAALTPSKTVYVTTVVSASAEPARVAPPPTELPSGIPVETATPSASIQAAAPPSGATATAPPSAPRASTMRAERILLEAANAALMRGDAAAAINALAEHKRSYPHGELAQERDILMAQAQKLKASPRGAPKP
ncbi:MAG: hypothetical protein U0414_40805 [Polyangiaceae bacterium]